MGRYTRRQALALGVTTISGLAGCSGERLNDSGPPVNGSSSPADGSSSPTEGRPTRESGTPARTLTPQADRAPVDVRGALYLPARAFNHYQMWANYDRSVIERDLGYAARLNLNAVRSWLSFEHWREEPEAHARKLEHFLSTAADHDIRVLIGFFDSVGKNPNEERLHDTNLRTATAVRSPPDAVSAHPDNWDVARKFIRWFMDRHRDDDRLLGIEANNEPGWSGVSRRFTRGMMKTMREESGEVPLTVGSTSVANDTFYREWGSEIMQFHYNFPRNRRTFQDALRQIVIVAERMDDPFWLTEWQRVRQARGFHSAPPKDQRVPNYSSMAPIIHSAGMGNFFWSLMLKPAHVRSQRRHGILNGVFHEDGAVWSLEDARALKAMSGESSFEGEERQQWPEWAKAAKGGF